MKRLLATMAACAVLQLAAGCKSTGGECDCAPVPGDSVGVNPHLPGYGAHGVHSTPATVIPGGTVAPVTTIPQAEPKTIPPLR